VLLSLQIPNLAPKEAFSVLWEVNNQVYLYSIIHLLCFLVLTLRSKDQAIIMAMKKEVMEMMNPRRPEMSLLLLPLTLSSSLESQISPSS